MAKYTITYKCGHQEEVQLYGKESEREKKIAYYSTIDCPHCRAEQARKEAEEFGLPQLKGSMKQIGWADDIRRLAKSNVEKMYELPTLKKEVAEKAVEWLYSHIDAAWWIDNRIELGNSNIMTFVKFLARNCFSNN